MAKILSRLFYFLPITFPAVTIISQYFGDPLYMLKWSPFFCPINKLTGWLCPTCGLGRSLILSVQLQFSKAFEYHFLGPIIVMFLICFWILLLFNKQYIFKKIRLNTGLFTIIIFLYCIYGINKNL